MAQRYTPVSEFDDATLAQKREYWRKKKREQRARRSEKKGTASKPSLYTVPPASSFPLHNKTTNLPTNPVRPLQTGNGTLANYQTQQFNLNPCSVTSKIGVKCISQINKNPALISQLNSSSSVPPLTKNHSMQPRVSVRIPSIPNSHTSPIPVFVQPKTTGNLASVSSPCSTKSTPPFTTNSALAKQQRPTNASASPAKVETEEEKAARRRELWRIKKREQRAKLADRLGKTKIRAQNVQKPHSGNAVPVHIPSPCLAQSDTLGKLQKLQTNMAPQFQTPPSLVVVKRPFEPIRKTPSPFHLSGVVRARCPTPWQNLVKQKLLKIKPPSSYLYGCKGLPPIEPGDTPEQVVSKCREYWRVKKREQRAKLSTEVKSRLRERADLQRRVKRYHKILEDMRKARSQSIMHASETIGGFIKEDGTVTINIPQVTVNFSAQKHRSEQMGNVAAYSAQPHISQYNLQPPLPSCVPAKMLMGQKTIKQQTGTCSNSQKVPIQKLGSHLTLTHPPAALSTGATTGGCVMKMAVSCKAPVQPKAYLDPSLTEEERMAKKREYWRTKKREQRAARAVRLRQGLSQARASAVLLKRKAQKHVAAVSQGKRLPKQSGGMINNNVAYANEMKQLSEFVPAVDLNLSQAICPELQPPMSRTPPPAQADPDPALSADNQATTLLAVASMKKLLEESLSSVSECQPETGIKMEAEEEKCGVVDEDIKPDVSQVDVCAPITSDVMLQTDPQVKEDTSFDTKDFSQITSSCAPLCPPENSTQAPSYSIVQPKIEPPDCFQRRTQRSKKAGHQHCCSPEPPKLHHPPIEILTGVQAQHHNEATRPPVLPSGLNSLQQKREYWKLMKRQQRARLKAKQRSSTNVMSNRSVQSAGLGCSLNKSSVMKPTLLPKPCAQSGSASSANMPAVLLVSPSTSNAGPQSTLRVKSPVSSRDSDMQTRRKTANRIMNITSPSSLPTLKPPANPLTSVNLLPIEPPVQNITNITNITNVTNITRNLRSITAPCPPKQNTPLPVKSVSNLVPPKPIPGESNEDFQKRKREYWRIKKKEQRARKAIQDKDNKSPQPSCSQNLPQCTPQEPPQTHCEQDSDAWMSPSVHSEDPINHSADSDDGSFSFPSYSVPLDDGYDFEGQGGEEGVLSGELWRNNYLMDYDPLNQLLVCIVCGDLQYVHSLEAVRGHIEEAHPHTLSLESGERRRLLQAWDEQVFHRERFFTNQLQQHSSSMTEAHMN